MFYTKNQRICESYWSKRFDKFHAVWHPESLMITGDHYHKLYQMQSFKIIFFQDKIFVIKTWRDGKGLAEKMYIHQFF